MVPVSNSSVFRGEPWKPGRHFCSCSSSTLSFPFPSQQQQPHDAGQKVFKKCRPELQPPGGGGKWYYAKCQGAGQIGNSFSTQTPSWKRLFPAKGGFKPSWTECASRLSPRSKTGQPPVRGATEPVSDPQVRGLHHGAEQLLIRATTQPFSTQASSPNRPWAEV